MATTITGAPKFLDVSACVAANGATISSSSGSGGAPNCLDRNADTYWTSSGSSDIVTETLTITFPVATAITRLILQDINWKQFTVKYDLLGAATDFTTIFGLDGSVSTISETSFADMSAYYEFASVTTSILYITVTKTQTVNAEKYIAQVIATTEIGTLVGYPEVKKVSISKNSRSTKTLSGKWIIQKSIETASITMDFKEYPRSSTFNVDFDLMMTLHDRQNPFYVWLCGGRRGTKYFGYTLRGYRLKDLYYMQVSKGLDLSYSKNIYQSRLNTSVAFEEHI